MKLIYSFLCCFFFLSIIYAQDQAWLLGCAENSVDSTDNKSYVIDFKKNNYTYPPYTQVVYNPFFFLLHYITTTGVTDENGNFKLSFNGSTINKVPYPNASTPVFHPSIAKTLSFNNTLSEVEQSAILLPHVALKDNYVLVYTEKINNEVSLFYSQISLDASLSSPFVVKKAVIATGKFDEGGVTVTRYHNGEDWLLLLREKQADTSIIFHSFLIDKTGMKPLKKQVTNYKTIINSKKIRTTFSPDGKHLAVMQTANNKPAFVELFSFDRCKTEIKTNKVKTFSFVNDTFVTNSWGGIAFSENSRFLYITTGSSLQQYDIQTQDSTLIYQHPLTNPYCTLGECYLNDLRLAPDGRIYIMSVNSRFMSVIKKPNEKGNNCEFTLNGLKLPTINCSPFGTNVPYYRLGKADCDVATDDKNDTPFISIFPNPTTDFLQVKLSSNAVFTDALITFYDALGQVVYTKTIKEDETIACSAWAKGFYSYQLTTSGKTLQTGKLVKM